jgi:hypothetical protein
VDVLWGDDKDIVDPAGAGVDLFGNKTQGYPYHLALLAVGILLENRFPGRCFVHGDLEREAIDQTLLWVNAVLGTDFRTPVCNDGAALFERLSRLYRDSGRVIERFEVLFHGSNEETLRTLLACVGPQALQRHEAEKLARYQSLSQLGASGALSTYLGVTQDMDALIDLVEAARGLRSGSEYSLEALLEVLCRHFITLDLSEREPLFAFSRPAGQMATIEDTFAHIGMLLAGVPSDFPFHMDGAELLERFAAREPGRRERFRAIIEAEEARCRQTLAEIAEAMAAAGAGPRPSALPPQAGEGVLVDDTQQEGMDALDDPDAALPGSAYLIRQIERQREAVMEPETTAEAFGVAVGKVLRDHEQVFADPDPQRYRGLIGWGAQENGIALWREAWDAIDREADLEVLKALAALVLIPEREAQFWKARIHILEHKGLWSHLLAGAGVRTGLPWTRDRGDLAS